MYGWTFDQIADMTPHAHLVALAKGSPGTLHFNTQAEYDEHMAKRARKRA